MRIARALAIKVALPLSMATSSHFGRAAAVPSGAQSHQHRNCVTRQSGLA